MTSLAEVPSVRRAEAARSPFDSPVVLAVLVLVALVSLYDPRTLAPVLGELRLPDTDDMMRLVGVRDLLGGQGWFDNVQHRMLPPDGIASHWSRLIDLPIAGLILALTPLLGRALAEGAAAALWPPLLFILYGALAFAAIRRLFGWRAALLVLFVAPQTGAILNVFQFGRIDHHNAQSCAVLALALALADPARRAGRGILAGLVGGLSLAIGLESLPIIAVAGLFLVADWVLTGERAGGMLAGFGAALFGASLVLFGLQTAPALWTTTACDALSPPWLMLAAGGGAVGMAAMVAERCGVGRAGRAAIAAGLGTALAVGLVVVAPACLAGPFTGMDALVRSSWLDQVDEMRSFAQVLRRRPDAALANIAPLIVAAIYAGAMALREPAADRRRFFLVVAALIGPGMLVALAQVRGLYVAGAFVPLIAGIALDRAIRTLRGSASTLRRLAVLALALAMLSKTWSLAAGAPLRLGAPAGIGAQTVSEANWKACIDPVALAGLDRLPKGLVLSIIDLGPAILLHTRHTVVAAPYHRNLVGLRAAIAATEGSQEALRRAVSERGADYLVLCTAALEEASADKPEPFATALARGVATAPDWLEPITDMPAGSALRVWRITRG